MTIKRRTKEAQIENAVQSFFFLLASLNLNLKEEGAEESVHVLLGKIHERH